jgi:hypothetical protein
MNDLRESLVTEWDKTSLQLKSSICVRHVGDIPAAVVVHDGSYRRILAAVHCRYTHVPVCMQGVSKNTPSKLMKTPQIYIGT